MGEKTALIIIDIINKMDFQGANQLLDQTKPIVQPLLQLKYHAKKMGMSVIYINDNFGLWHEDVTNLIKVCKKGIGKEIIEQFIPEKDDFFIIKPKHSGFYGTQLEILLKRLHISNLILTGIAGDLCVLFTAFDAYMREYNLWVPSNCIATETAESYRATLHIINHSMSINTSPFKGQIETSTFT